MAFNIAYTYQLIDKYTAPIQKIIAATRAHTRYLKENQDAIKASNATLTKMANRAERLGGSLKALESNNALKHLAGQARDLNAQIDKMGRATLPRIPGAGGGGAPGAQVGVAGATGGGRMSRFGAAASGLTGVGGGMAMGGILKQTAAVENAMIDLGRATDLPAAELKKFEERFMTLSEKIGISTDKLAIMAFEGSKMGLKTDELDKFVKITANAAVSFEILEDEAGRALGSIKAKLGLNIGALQELMDRVNFVADATSADGKNMIEIIERLSGTFKTLKVPPEVAAGFAAVADQLETSPELAASGMNMVINKMMQSSALAEKMFKAPAETMRKVFSKLASMPEAKRIAAATKMFGDEAGRFAVKLAGNMSLFDETMKKAAESRALGSMEREMASKLKSLSMLWRNMKNAVMNVMVAIGEGLAPEIKQMADSIRGAVPSIRAFVREHPGIVKLVVAVIAFTAAVAVLAPVVWAVGSGFAFLGAMVALLASPLALIAVAAAAIALRWNDWYMAGHPVVELVGSITDRIGRLVDRFMVLTTATDGSNIVINTMAKAFDLLGYALVIPLKLLDAYLAVLEKIVGTQAEIKPISGANISNLVPPNLKAATNVGAMTSPAPTATVGGMITVKAEPGTKAKVSQPNLPTGSNLLMVQ